jgi:hypothetical protein
VQARLDREASGTKGFGSAVLGLASVVAVVALAVTVADLDPVATAEDVYEGGPEDRYQQAVAVEHAEAAEHRRACERSLRDLLARTELAPGQTVRGELWFPAWPLGRVLNSAPSASYEWSITALPSRSPSDHALTLRTPDGLGGQEIDYSIAGW